MKRVLFSLLFSSIANLAITVVWKSSRPIWQYDWRVDDVIFLFYPLLAIYAFSALGVAFVLPLLTWLKRCDLDANLRFLLVVTAAAVIGYLMMLWAPNGAMLGALSAMITIAILRLVAPSLFLRSE